MQLDRTHVAIRRRSLSEIGDLALMLIRQYPQSLCVGFALGALPWILCNWALLGWIPWSETAETVYDEETVQQRYRYMWLMASLVFLQTPLAGVLTTYYIGQAVFEQRPTWRSVFRETCRVYPRLLWSLGVVRGAIPAMLLVLSNWGEPMAVGREVLWILLLLVWAMGLRGFRSFLPEILLLERCPIRAKKEDGLSAHRRSQLLHNPLSGELLGRFMLTGTLIGLLAVGLFYSFVWCYEMLFAAREWSLIGSLVLLPLALWTAAGVSVLVRFLSYLDSRIRLEGWEVELGLRAEAIRQFGPTSWPDENVPRAEASS